MRATRISTLLGLSFSIVAVTAACSDEPSDLSKAEEALTSATLHPFVANQILSITIPPEQCIDVPNAETADWNLPLQTFNCHGGRNQDWWISSAGQTGGKTYYQIRAGHDGRCMAVDNFGVLKHGECNGGELMLWEIQEAFGAARLKAKLSGLCPHMAGVNSPITVDSTCALEWKIRAHDGGNNVIAPAHAPTKCVDLRNDNSNPIQQFSCHGGTNQHWRFNQLGTGPGQYSIQSMSNLECLEVANGSMSNGAAIHHAPCNGTSRQRWLVDDVGGDNYRIKNVLSNKCVDVTGSATGDFVVMQQSTCNGAANQRYRIGNWTYKHVQVILLSSDGVSFASLTDTQIADYLFVANNVLGPAGITLLYDPATDRSTVTNPTLNSTTPTADNGAAGNALASQFPGKIVLMVRTPSVGGCGAFAGAGMNWAFTIEGTCAEDCAGSRSANMAHELGHFFGLNHTMAGANPDTLAGIQAACSGGDPMVFDADWLLQTPPEPYWSAAKLANCASTSPTFTQAMCGTVLTIPKDNIMGYYYFSTTPGSSRGLGKRIVPEPQRAIIRAFASVRGLD